MLASNVITYLSHTCAFIRDIQGRKIRFCFLLRNHLISFPNEFKNIVKKIRQTARTLQKQAKNNLSFTVADIFLLLAFYRNIFCFFTTDLQSDAIFVFAADIPFLGHPVYHPDKGASM